MARQNAIPAMKCVCCGGRARIRTSKEVSPTMCEIYYQCTDLHCGAIWKTHNQFVELTSPSARGPVRQTVPLLRLKPRGPLSPGAPIPPLPDG